MEATRVKILSYTITENKSNFAIMLQGNFERFNLERLIL